MRNFLIVFMLAVVIISCKKEEKIDFEYVTTKFKEHSNNVERIEYNAQKIDTFPGGVVWNNKGYALIEKDANDDIFGFSFYGKRNDVDKEYLYDKGNGFEISKKDEIFEIDSRNFGFIGSPGGQMISRQIFYLDSIYKSAELIESSDKYILKYEFEDDTIYNVKKVVKTIELNKSNFIPTKVTTTSERLDNKVVNQIILSDVKINSEVVNSIQTYKAEIKDYKIIQKQKRKPNKILNNEFPEIELSNLMNEGIIVNLRTNKLTLIDFWEVWCGHCISSFPKVEKLKNKYSESLQVVGIVTEDRENAIKLIEEKETTFLNLFGTKGLLNEYSVNSYPRYFLIDKNGIVQKEYRGFSEQIEKDIKEIISE
jgi:thiol-disulfide isomerase/thioredoxin